MYGNAATKEILQSQSSAAAEIHSSNFQRMDTSSQTQRVPQTRVPEGSQEMQSTTSSVDADRSVRDQWQPAKIKMIPAKWSNGPMDKFRHQWTDATVSCDQPGLLTVRRRASGDLLCAIHILNVRNIWTSATECLLQIHSADDNRPFTLKMPSISETMHLEARFLIQFPPTGPYSNPEVFRGSPKYFERYRLSELRERNMVWSGIS